MTLARLTALGLLASLAASPATFRRRARLKASAQGVTLRKRTNVNRLIATPGSVEIDWSNLYSFSSSTFSMPSAIRWTPGGSGDFWSRTELSASVDAVSSAPSGDGRVTQFSEAMTFAATTVLVDRPSFDIAVAPVATFFLRQESGARLGAAVLGRWDKGGNSVSGTITWSAATNATDSNPRQLADFGAGYARKLGNWSPHANAVWEVATASPPVLSLFEGVGYQVNSRITVDVSGQHISIHGGPVDHQLLLGFTFSLSRR